MEPFKTEMIVDDNRRIIALSDVHVDIFALIVCLRDCAKVIRKKDGFNFDQNKLDSELEVLLRKNIWDPTYKYDLNYEWCGGETIVVMVGDTLDGKRTGNTKKEISILGEEIGNETLYYPHIEIKILYFINRLNLQSFSSQSVNYGRIIKLLGNHEVGNFTDLWKDNRFLFNKDIRDTEYINLLELGLEGEKDAIDSIKDKSKVYENRRDVFRIDTSMDTTDFGFKLFLETTGTGILLKINNNVFVHGQLINSMTFNDYDAINTLINSYSIANKKKIFDALNLLNNETSPLWMRNWGQLDRVINDRRFCNKVNDTITHFCSTLPNCKSKDIRVIIGHCSQFDSTYENKTNSTFSKLILKDGIVEVFTNDSIYTGRPTNDNIFGITAECYNNNTPSIIKVDIGMSRSFDMIDDINNIIRNDTDFLVDEAKYYNGRTPQVIEIIGNKMRIIRSSMKNTSIHLPRPSYKEKLHFVEKANTDAIKRMTNHNSLLKQSIYYNKYMKYKSKYMVLKNTQQSGGSAL